MKKIFIIITALFITSFFSSCNMLNLSPEDYNSSNNFWKNKAQVNAFAIGLHADLRGAYPDMMFILGEARGGTQKVGTSSQNTSLNYSSPVKDNSFTKDNTGVSKWMGLYSKILQVNHFIQNLEEGCKFLSKEERNYYLGQGYGLRAFYYFYLYRTYGGVPIIEQVKVLEGKIVAKDLYKERATAKATLDFIKADLQKSITAFGEQTEIKNRKAQWSLYASLLLKAEIYLWSAKVSTGDQTPTQGDIDKAETALESILNSGIFSLADRYKKVFEYSNKGNQEVIFCIRYADGEASNFMPQFSYQNAVFVNLFKGADGKLITTDTLETKNGLQRHEYKWELFASYSDRDQRKRDIFLDYYNKDTGEPAGTVVKKYNGFINEQGNRSWSDDFVVYRYADALLLMAEIKNYKGESVAPYINKIRQRAYGAAYDSSIDAYTDADFSSNELAILKERDKEFVLEGKRWFDLRRMQQSRGGDPLAFSPKASYEPGSPVIAPSKAHLLLWPIDVKTLNDDPKLEPQAGY